MSLARRSLPAATFALMAATVIAGLWLARHDGRELGLPFPPFVGRWAPAIGPWALVAVALIALAVLAAPRMRSLPLPRSPPPCSGSRSRCGSRWPQRAAARTSGRACSTPARSRDRTSTSRR